MRRSNLLKLSGAAALVACSLLARGADGVVVWADDFTGEANGATPTSDFAGGAAGNDYAPSGGGTGTYTVSDAIGNAAPGLQQIDPDGASAPTLAVGFAQWGGYSGLSAANNLLTARFDFRVDSFESGVDNSNPRFILRHANLTAQQVTIAFGRTATNHIDDGPGGGDHDLVLAAHVATSNSSLVVPSNANAVGLNQGSGWAPGFDFGNYDPDTSLNDTHDQFYHVEVTYDFNTGAVTGSATNVATGESAPINRTMTANLSFAGTASSGSGILMSSFGGNLATAYFDNIEVSVTPEPSASLALLAGAGVFAARRERRRR